MNAPARRNLTADSLLAAADSQASPYSIWLSSGTACLIASLEAFDVRGKWIALPPNVCPNVVAAVLAAGCKPWFVDVEPERQGMNPDCLAEIISEVAAVIAVHAYGTPCSIDEIMAVARRASVPVVEDCAQADGATCSGREVGQFGDVAVFSFGTGKIVDAGGGGLVQTRNPTWHARLQHVTRLWAEKRDPQAGEALARAYKDFYNRFYPDRTRNCQDSFGAVMRDLAPGFRGKPGPTRVAELQEARSNRDWRVSERRRKYALYARLLEACEALECVPLTDGAAPWRFNVLTPEDRRDSLFRAMLDDGLKVSTWYPDITLFLSLGAYKSTTLTVAQRFDRRVLNLWIDDQTLERDVEHNSARLVQSVARSLPDRSTT